MRKRTLVCLVLAFLLTAFFIQDLEASKETLLKNVKSRAFTKSVTSAPGKTLYVERTRGDLSIIGTEQNEISVKAIVEVGDTDEEFLEEFLGRSELILEPYRQGFRLALVTPREEIKKNRAILPGFYGRYSEAAVIGSHSQPK